MLHTHMYWIGTVSVSDAVSPLLLGTSCSNSSVHEPKMAVSVASIFFGFHHWLSWLILL